MSDIVVSALERIERLLAKKKLTKAERERFVRERAEMRANAARTRRLAERAQAKLAAARQPRS